MVVLNGSGTGQIRRIVKVSLASDGNVAYTIDKAFVAPLAIGSSWMQVLPFRGRNIFRRNTYRDVGALQFYGIGLDNIASNNVGQRMGGFIAWGQWRGYDHGDTHIPQPSSDGGGSGANPNLHGQFDDTSGGFGCFINGSAFIVTDTTHWMPDGTATHFNGKVIPKLKFPINSMLVFRGNIMDSNSGIRVERQAEDVLIEHNHISNSDAPIL